MGLQGTLSNFAAGIMLLVFRPFKVGQYISVSGTAGTVEEIDLFTTSLNTLDNVRLVVPNGQVFGQTIHNFGHQASRRVVVPVGVAYSADIDATRAALEKAVAAVPGALRDPAPQVFLAGLGASAVDWQVRVWCGNDDYWATWEATVRAVKMALDEAGISIPFPQLDVHVSGNPSQLQGFSGR
jgi:small conductance mechanosensitive channel